ncbi:MAG: lipid-A-disaccharide synthase [Caulobacteraceae bacterium]
MGKTVTVMLVALEASADNLGANLAIALRRRLGQKVRFVGVGGARMAAEGIESPFDTQELAIVGFVEAWKAYPRVRKHLDETLEVAHREKPDVVVLIDAWAFTIRVAQRMRKEMPDVPLVKYVAPQLWATRPGRAKTLAATVDHLLAIHKMDLPFFEKVGLPTTFVGNATLTRDFSRTDPARTRALIGAGPKDRILLMLPGSRKGEIRYVMPAFKDAVDILVKTRPDLKIVLPVAAQVADLVNAQLAGWSQHVHVVEDDTSKADAFAAATAALACSGTITTELALAGAPMVVAYKVDGPTAMMARLLLRTKWITLFNIAAKAFVAPELIQEDCTGPKIAAAVAPLLDDPARRGRQIAEQNVALEMMGRGIADPANKSAETIISILKQRGRL